MNTRIVVFIGIGAALLVGAVRYYAKRQAAAAAGKPAESSVADESAAQSAAAQKHHIDVDYVGGVVH
jgi:hypothetical protein